MFEAVTDLFVKATDIAQKQYPASEYPKWFAPLMVLLFALFLLLAIREFWCWFWKTSHIAGELDRVKAGINKLHAVSTQCKEELSKANAKLERIACAAAGIRPPDSNER